MRTKNLALCASIALYILYIFLENWATSAGRMGEVGLELLFSGVSTITLSGVAILMAYGLLLDINTLRRKRWTSIVILSIIAFLLIAIGSISIALPIALGLLAANSNLRLIAKTILSSLITLIVASTILHTIGLTGGDVVSKPLFGSDSDLSTTAPAFGLSNPNSLMVLFISVIAMTFIITRSQRQDFLAAIALATLTVILSSLTGSTTGLLAGLGLILLTYSAKHSDRALRRLKKVTPKAFPIITILTFAVALLFGPSSTLPNPVNDTLTTRPYTWNLRIENESYLNMYGNNDEYLSSPNQGADKSHALDNMTLYILVYYGIPVYLIILLIIYRGAKLIDDPAIQSYILIACLLMFTERMYLYSLVFIFLTKAVVEHYYLDATDQKKAA